MKPILSIIVPCYNCSSTLREAVDSCYKQGLSNTEFEIIMIDDGSTDTTQQVMSELASKHSNVRTIFHDKNKGGGAARNTGIKASTGEIIYCLDSDNFFASESVKPMLTYLKENSLDGVVFHDRRFFSGTNHKKFHSHLNPTHSRPVTLADIFSIKENVLLDNFFYTRNAYERTEGYPENHGFDTQCFELRFLAAGNHAIVYPNSIFFHRQDPGQNSYFQRVYKSGLFSRNIYLMCEDIIHLLSPSTRRIIMEFEVFQKTKLGRHNLKAILDLHLTQVGIDFFIPQYENFLHKEGAVDFFKLIEASTTPEDIFTKAIIAHNFGDSNAAISHIHKLLESGTDSSIVYFNLLRYSATLTKKYPSRGLEDEVQKLITTLIPKPQKLSRVTRMVTFVTTPVKRLFT